MMKIQFDVDDVEAGHPDLNCYHVFARLDPSGVSEFAMQYEKA
jgi:hypothetical protein